jgi:hypothetical protein
MKGACATRGSLHDLPPIMRGAGRLDEVINCTLIK